MRAAFFTVLGLSILLLVVYDVYATILHARARSGPIGELLNRVVWGATRFIAFKLSRPRRHRLLNTVGPILMPLLIIVLIALTVLGFAFIYYPRMPEQFNVSVVNPNSSWVNSFYFSGITLTTVGYGDIAPQTTAMRVTALFEAASGFALISLAITYLIAVYQALQRKRAVALSFYHQAEEGANAAGFIIHHFVSGRFYGIETTLRLATRDIQELLESHVEHPVIHYFHPVEVYKSLPRMLFLVLEVPTVIRSCLSNENYAELCNHPEVRTLDASGRHVLKALISSLELERRASRRKESRFDEAKRWKHRFNQTMRKLKEAGIETRTETEAAWEEYRARREEWEAQLHRFSTYLGYDWDEITGDRDLRYAADEEMEEPEGER